LKGNVVANDLPSSGRIMDILEELIHCSKSTDQNEDKVRIVSTM